MRAMLLLTAAFLGLSVAAPMRGAAAQANPDSGQIIQSLKFRGIHRADPAPDPSAGAPSPQPPAVANATPTQPPAVQPPAAQPPATPPAPDQSQATQPFGPRGGSNSAAAGHPGMGQPGMAPPPPPPVETPSVSLNVQFPTGSADLTFEAMRTLDQLGRALRDPQLAGYRFRIEGHTDTVGSPAYNQYLSERRAQAVIAYLVRFHDVPRARLVAVGMGMEGLLVPTPPQTPEFQNRRVLVVNMGA